MAKKITELNEATELVDNDVLPVVRFTDSTPETMQGKFNLFFNSIKTKLLPDSPEEEDVFAFKNGQWIASSDYVTQLQLEGYALISGQYPVNVVAASGSEETLPATYPAHNVVIDNDCTFSFGTPNSNGHTFLLKLTGQHTPTFPASVIWGGGEAPDYESPSIYAFTTLDGGTVWIGSLVAGDLS